MSSSGDKGKEPITGVVGQMVQSKEAVLETLAALVREKNKHREVLMRAAGDEYQAYVEAILTVQAYADAIRDSVPPELD